MSEPTVKVTAYEVSCLPEDHIDAYHFTLRVVYRGKDRWAVVDGPWCLDADGNSEYESLPSNRTDEFLAVHRFDLDTALNIARKYAPKMRINGFTVADVLARHNEEAGDA